MLISVKNNKWFRAAIPALLIHCSIGTVYCWSIFSQEISDHIGYSKSAIEWAFSLAIFFLGMSAAFMGKTVERDIHKSSLIATLFFTAGMIGTGVFIWWGGNHPHNPISLIGIYLSYGVIMGIGLGTGYLSPVKTLMLWFKDKKGLATGLAVAGFGAAKAIASPIMQFILNHVEGGIYKMFWILSVVYFIMMFTGHLILKKPDDWIELSKNEPSKKFKDVIDGEHVKDYIGIWLMFYLNITAGLAIISQEKMIVRCIGLGAFIGIIATVASIFNALGRVGFSSLGDKCEDRKSIYIAIFILSWMLVFIPAVGAACDPDTPIGKVLACILVILAIMMVNAGYGGGFSNLPTLLSDHYGMESISTIHGITLSAWAFAGLSGNQIATLVLKRFDSDVIPMVDEMGNSYTVCPSGCNKLLFIVALMYWAGFLICKDIVKKVKRRE